MCHAKWHLGAEAKYEELEQNKRVALREGRGYSAA